MKMTFIIIIIIIIIIAGNYLGSSVFEILVFRTLSLIFYSLPVYILDFLDECGTAAIYEVY